MHIVAGSRSTSDNNLDVNRVRVAEPSGVGDSCFHVDAKVGAADVA